MPNFNTPSAPPQGNNFHLIRLLLASLVLLSHAPELRDGDRHREIWTRVFHTLSFGELAVDGFFLLSGFLIVKSWEQGPQVATFLKKRVLRIYPGFVAASLVCAFVVGPLASHPAIYFAHFSVPRFVLNVCSLHVPATPTVFQGTHDAEVNGAMWTISYEFRCYLLVALLGLLGFTRLRARWLALSLLVSALSLMPHAVDHASVHGHALFGFHGRSFLIGEPSTLLRLLSLFCVGGCFYLFRDRIRFQTRWAWVALPVFLLALFHTAFVPVALLTLGAYLLFGFAFAPLRRLAWRRSWPDLSYGVYLYGWPLQKLILWYLPTLSPWLLFALSLTLAVACGWVSWHAVEGPFLRLKERRLFSIPRLPGLRHDAELAG